MNESDEEGDIRLNGDLRRVRSGTTVSALLCELEIRQDRVAVEVNREILDRGEFDRRALRAGDHVEVISFIGGGQGIGTPILRLFGLRGSMSPESSEG